MHYYAQIYALDLIRPLFHQAKMVITLKYRKRFDPFVFMSTKPFAKWKNYIFHSAALM